MNKEDEKLIAGYMGWKKAYLSNGYHNILYNRPVVFDLNDAALCVQEMQKRGEIDDFTKDALMICLKTTKVKALPINFTAWLMSMEEGQAKNFFKSMVEWRKGK